MSAPFGQRAKLAGKGLEPDAGERAVLATIAEGRRRGMGPKAIAVELARAGCRNRRGALFTAAAVARLIAAAEAIELPLERGGGVGQDAPEAPERSG